MSLKSEAEITLESEPCVLVWDNDLFVGTENGCIKSFDGTLTPKESWEAHGAQLFTLASGNNNLYSSSNDGGVRIWSRTGEKITELPPTGADITALRVFDTRVYAGDEEGHIVVYENSEIKAAYNVLEEVKDLWYEAPYLFTTRDSFITITEINPEESKTRFTTRCSIEGRAPLRVRGNKIVFVSRNGNNLCLHESSIENRFAKLDEVKVSGMIVTALETSGNIVWTGGWDGTVHKWQIVGDKLKAAGEINLGGCINSIATVDERVYVAVSGGKVVQVA